MPEEISDESRTKLRQILDIADRYGELNLKEANDILVRATPKPTTRQINTPMKGLSSTAATPTVARETPQKYVFLLLQKIIGLFFINVYLHKQVNDVPTATSQEWNTNTRGGLSVPCGGSVSQRRDY